MYCVGVDGSLHLPSVIHVFVSPTLGAGGCEVQLTYGATLAPAGTAFVVLPLPPGPAEILVEETAGVPNLFTTLSSCFPSTVDGGGVAAPGAPPPPPPPPPRAPPLAPHGAALASAGELPALLPQGGCGAALVAAFPGSGFLVCAPLAPPPAGAPWPAALALRHARPSASTLHVPLPAGGAGGGGSSPPLTWTLYSAGALREEGSWASGGKSATEAFADIRQRHASGSRRRLLPPALLWPQAGMAAGVPASLQALLAHVYGAGAAGGGGEGGPLLLRRRSGAAAPPLHVALLLQGAAVPAVAASDGGDMDVAKGGKSVSWAEGE